MTGQIKVEVVQTAADLVFAWVATAGTIGALVVLAYQVSLQRKEITRLSEETRTQYQAQVTGVDLRALKPQEVSICNDSRETIAGVRVTWSAIEEHLIAADTTDVGVLRPGESSVILKLGVIPAEEFVEVADWRADFVSLGGRWAVDKTRVPVPQPPRVKRTRLRRASSRRA